MDQPRSPSLFALADLIHAVSRQMNFNDDSGKPVLTPLETTVLRYVDRHPGTAAGAAAKAVSLQPSNFSRALRSLETKGYLRREQDAQDARAVRLHPTELAARNLEILDATWTAMLQGIVDDDTRDTMITGLERIEHALVERHRHR
ncbi:MarR family winged helix-turn-helix transcriptional regulator [Microbacterium sp. NPDC076911]|uniref:MarR family winged helix-turn-helix transcriptional regulator n=1 Tax=Microbacterium sp. NPDC076911 TaxID=3154958 RepID=UPI003422B698